MSYKTRVVGTDAPNEDITLQRRSGDVINITDADVELILKDPKGNVTNVGHQECNILNAPDGVIEYDVKSTDYPVPGLYFGDVKITYSNNEVEIMTDYFKRAVRAQV